MRLRNNIYFPREPEVFFDLEPHKGRSVSFTIMAHEKRAAWAEQLAQELDCSITWDRHNDRHETGLRAIKAYEPSATHHCVVQDDVILAPNFKDEVKKLILYPEEDAPVGLYYGGKGSSHSAHVTAHQFAQSRQANWVIRRGPIWGPAIIYPVRTIPDLVKFYEESHVQNYDRRVMRFYQSVKKHCWYTIPSLVEHRVDDNPSLCGHDRPNRQARVFGPQPGTLLRWDGPAVRSNL